MTLRLQVAARGYCPRNSRGLQAYNPSRFVISRIPCRISTIPSKLLGLDARKLAG